MTILSKRLHQQLASTYEERYGMRPRFMGSGGNVDFHTVPGVVDMLPGIVHARAHALEESLRWGAPYIFFLAPGIISWVIPLVNEFEVVGGFIGGEVVAEDEAEDRLEAVNHLVTLGCDRTEAERYVGKLPVWPHGETQEAADYLYVLAYQLSGWTPMLLQQRREKNQQHRQIAEEMHRRKEKKDVSYPHDDERVLISLIRAGDRSGARGVLNRMLGAIFLKSANLTIVRALLVEMMGYLVRRAVEDSPYLEPLLEKNHLWMARIIEAPDFEELSHVVRSALDDFMENIFVMGYREGNSSVQKALEYISRDYRNTISLKEVAEYVGLSTFRIAHLVKEHTGKSILQHVHRMRVMEAQRLLEHSAMPCTEIAYEVGFGDQSYFTKQFRLLLGTTPAKYRKTQSWRKA